MFREITISKQTEGGPKRRWYQSDYFDLYIFYIRHSERMDKHADREFVGMQLCYDIRRNQRTLEWKKADGFSHHSVKKGGDTLSDHGASASLLQKGGTFDAAKVIDRFMKESSSLPAQVKTFVLQKLAEYAKLNPPAASAAAAPIPPPVAARRSAAVPPPPTMSAGEYELFSLNLPIPPVPVESIAPEPQPVRPAPDAEDVEPFSLDDLLKS